MRSYPEGTPQFVIEAIENVEELAHAALATDPNKDFAAGRACAVREVIQQLESFADEEKSKREDELREALERTQTSSEFRRVT